VLDRSYCQKSCPLIGGRNVLDGQRALLLKGTVLFKNRVVVTDLPYHTLGLTRWSIVQPLTLIVGGICSVLIVVGALFSPGPASEIAMVNRGFGLLMVWMVVFFLLADR
jgi:hypothetical protein